MRIALVILSADISRGGAERYTVDLAAALVRRGHEISICSGDFPNPPAGVTHVPIIASAPTRSTAYVRFLASLEAHLQRSGYDVVHAMLPVRGCDVYHPHAGLAMEAVASGHLKYDSLPRRGLAKLANRFNARRQRFAATERLLLNGPRPPVVLCLSEYVKQTVRRHYSLPESRMATLFNAVDTAHFNPIRDPEAGLVLRRKLGLTDGKIVALFVAHDFHRKGLATAIRALARVEDPRLMLIVAGRPVTSKYEKLSAELGIASRIVFVGPTTDTHPLYLAADFFVLPTRHDPCSLVVLESLAMGVPVITTRFNGAAEIMTPDRHGYIMQDAGDVESLAQAMRQLLDGPRRAAMSAASLELRSALSHDRHVDRLLEIYSIAIASP